MRQTVLILACALLSSCAIYTLQITTPDGLQVTGRALVMNESEDVSLSVKSDTYVATFGKQGTEAGATAEMARDVVDILNGPGIPGL
jgi:hypothetical protein